MNPNQQPQYPDQPGGPAPAPAPTPMPTSMPTPSQPPAPLAPPPGGMPPTQVVPPGPGVQFPTAPPPQAASPKNNRKMIIIGAVTLLVILMAVVAFVLMRQPETHPSSHQTEETSTEPEGPQAATAVDTEKTSNAISQDLSGLNDDKDLPATQLDDKTLGL